MLDTKRLDKIKSQKEFNFAMLIACPIVWAIDVAGLVLSILNQDPINAGLIGFWLGAMTVVIFLLAVNQNQLNKEFEQEFEKIEIQVLEMIKEDVAKFTQELEEESKKIFGLETETKKETATKTKKSKTTKK